MRERESHKEVGVRESLNKAVGVRESHKKVGVRERVSTRKLV